MEVVNGNTFQCDKRYFCKQKEKQKKFIIDTQQPIVTQILSGHHKGPVQLGIEVFSTFSRDVNKTNLLSSD